MLASWLAVSAAGAVPVDAGSCARLAAGFEADARAPHRVVSEAAGGRIGARGAPGAGTAITVGLPSLARGAAGAA